MTKLGRSMVHLDRMGKIHQQFGKLQAMERQIDDADTPLQAIGIARSMRGHVAVILKLLHEIQRDENFGSPRRLK